MIITIIEELILNIRHTKIYAYELWKMAFTLGEVLINMELDLPDATSQPAVSVQKKGFNLITSITAYLIGVSEDKFAEKDGVLAYDGAEYARLEKEEKAICCIIKIPKVADKNGESCISILEKIAG